MNVVSVPVDGVRVIELFGERYYRSDLAAQMVKMHRNTLLAKAREGKIRKYRHAHAVWFTEDMLKEYLIKESR